MRGVRRAACALAAAALASLSTAPAHAVATSVTSDPGTPPQQTWNFDQVHVPAARAAGHSGTGVLVAVLDSWVDGTHRDFEGRVLPGADCVGGTCKPGPASSDKCAHGTHVAGTVASSSYGVAPKARILPVRVLTYDPTSGNCVGQPTDVAAGIHWAVAHGAKVLNLSLGPDVPGLSGSTTIPSAVHDAAAAGAVVIFSAGNSSLPVTNSYGSDALIVAATARSGQLASYSQRGAGVDLAAPGGEPATQNVCTRADCITSLYPGNRYAVAAGTSMAAPHVSGIAALLLGQDPSRTRQQVIARLEDSARPLANAGHGLVDASAALGVTAPTGGPQPTRTPAAPSPAGGQSPPAAEPPPAPAQQLPPPGPVHPTAPLPVLTRGGSTTAPAQPPVVASSGPAVAGAPHRRTAQREDVPLPLALVAAALVIATGSSVALTRRR